MTLLDIVVARRGATMRRARDAQYDVNVAALTLSKNQAAHVQKSFDEMDTPRDRRVMLAEWGTNEPVDRYRTIGASGISRRPATIVTPTSSPAH